MFQHVARSLRVPLLSLSAVAMCAGPAIGQTAQHYQQTNLVSNRASLAPVVDPNLVNPWGLSRSSGGAWWVADNGPGLSTLYDGTGKIQPLVVTIPGQNSTTPSAPTGTIFNGDGYSFQVAPGKASIFLFVTEDGTISGWNPGVSPSAVIKVNHKEQSVYKGATIATAVIDGKKRTLLYTADFRQGKVAVFDAEFRPVELTAAGGSFVDATLPEGYVPFNVQNLAGNLYVTFAKQDSAKHDEIDGAGNGYVDVFSPTGQLLQRIEHGAWMNAPWGMAIASGDFGIYSHDLLVGQFGSGHILVFDPVMGSYKGMLETPKNSAIVIDGLWALAFGGGPVGNGSATALYFTAGPDNEQNGLFGSITAIENVQGNDQ